MKKVSPLPPFFLPWIARVWLVRSNGRCKMAHQAPRRLPPFPWIELRL